MNIAHFRITAGEYSVGRWSIVRCKAARHYQVRDEVGDIVEIFETVRMAICFAYRQQRHRYLFSYASQKAAEI